MASLHQSQRSKGMVNISTLTMDNSELPIAHHDVKSLITPQDDDEGGYDGARTFQLDFYIGRGERSVYQNKFSKSKIVWMAWTQVVLAIMICALQIATICLIEWSTSLETLGVGIWSCVIGLVAAKCSILTCKKITYCRLHLSMSLQLISMIIAMMLVMLALVDSIPSQKNRLYYYGYVEASVLTCLILTSIMVGCGLCHFLLSLLILFRAVSAICTRKHKLICKKIDMDGIEDKSKERQGPGYDCTFTTRLLYLPSNTDISLPEVKTVDCSRVHLGNY